MKIRCKNCYRVLNENEEYCTSCGEHSEAMAEYMRTGVRKASKSDKLKTALLLFAFIAFLGTGVLSISFAIIEGTVGENLIYEISGKLLTATALFSALVITFRKSLKGLFFNDTKAKTITALVVGLLVVMILSIVSTLTDMTKIIPNNFSEFLDLNKGFFPFIEVLFILILVSFCEEYIYRHRLIDFFDEDTMLNDGWTITLSTIISTALGFAWFMSVEVLIMTLLINVFMTFLYIKTNRSLGINIILKVVMYLFVMILNYIV